jgi:hypothetical protein
MDIRLKAYERMNHSHEREARASCVADRGLIDFVVVVLPVPPSATKDRTA